MTDDNVNPGFFRKYPCGPKVPDEPVTVVVQTSPVVTVPRPGSPPRLVTGWQCPGCGRCYAPVVTECPKCQPAKGA